MKYTVGSLAAALALLMSVGTVAAEPSDGTIDGQISNGTAGADVPTGDEVTLLVFGKADQMLKDQRTAPIGDDGRYGFAGLDRSSDLVYVVLVEHAGVAYSGSEPIDLQQEAAGHADIQVFDTTNSDAALRFDRLNLVVAGADPGLMQMYEMGTLVNAGDRTLVPEDDQASTVAHGLRLALPHGALGAEMQAGFQGADLTPTPGGVQVNSPIMPGQHEFALSFRLPYTSTSADLGLQIPYATATYNIYVPEGGPRLESDRLTTNGPANLGTRSFSLATAENVPDTSIISAHLDGLPSAGGELSPIQIVLAGVGALLVVLGLSAVAYGLRASRRGRPGGGRVERERQRLIRRLALLDERFELGRIPASEYQRARDESKRRLVQLTESQS